MRAVGIRLLSTGVAALGLIGMCMATAPRRQAAGFSHAVALVVGQPLTRSQAAMLGMLLLALAHGIAGRRRLAFQLGIAVLVPAILEAVPHRPGRVAFWGALLIALVTLRGEFRARPDAHRLRLAAMLGGGVLALLTCAAAWEVTAGRQRPGAVGRAALAAFTAASAPPGPHGALLTLMLAGGGIAMLVLALAPAVAPPPGPPAERARVAALVQDAGPDSLAPFATRQDKAYVFSPDKRGAIGYRVLFGIALAGGDPVGDPEASEAAAREFLITCADNGWRPAVLGASDTMRRVWRRAGLRGLVIGDEAVLDVASFTLSARRMRNVRQAVRRTHNAGVRVWFGPLSTERADTLRPILEDWLNGRRERGFSMNLDQILTPRPDCLVGIAYRPTGQPAAFARFAVCAGGRILTLDVAPRHRDAPNGVTERLVVEALEQARALGVSEVSLNFAGLRRVVDSPGPAGRAVRVLTRVLDRWIELASLNRFCAKFHPEWRPRSLLLRSYLELPAVGAAAFVAELGAPVREGTGYPLPGYLPDYVGEPGAAERTETAR